MYEQHNDHCMMFFNGEYWWITKMNGLKQINCQRWDGPHRHTTVLDLSRVRWSDYTEHAVNLIARNRDVLETSI